MTTRTPHETQIPAEEDADLSPSEDLDSDETRQPEATADILQDSDTDSRIAALEAERDEMRERFLRALADAETARRRAVRDREDATKFAIAGFARDLLDVADNFRRATRSIPDGLAESDPRIASLISGILAVEKDMLRIFAQNGIRQITPMDEPFNANYHEVMFEAPIPDKPAGTIIQLVEPGYLLNDRLLRPARVGVVKAAPPADPSSEPSSAGHLDTQA